MSDIGSAAPVAAEAAPERSSSPSLRKRIVCLAIAACAVLLGAALSLILPKTGNAPVITDIVMITPMEDSAPLIRSDDFYQGIGWFFGFTFTNTQDAPFTMTKLVQTIITDNGAEVPDTYTAEDLESWWGSSILTKDDPRKMIGGQPEQAIKAVRVTLTGTDAKGNELTFESYLTLSKEIKED